MLTTSSQSPYRDTPTQLVVGVDYDATCRHAALHALRLAPLFGVSVHLIHACSSPYAGHASSSDAWPAAPDEPNVLEAIHQQEAQAMARFAGTLGANDALSWSVESGDPKRVLLDYSQKHPGSWLVLGARKHVAIAEWLLGSTAGYVVRHCQVPVLVVPPQSNATPT